MDRYRFILALTLSLVVLIGWQVASHYFFPPPPPPSEISEVLTPPERTPDSPKPRLPVVPPAPVAQTSQIPQRDLEVVTPYWTAKFSNRGAVATSWILKKYRSGSVEREITAAHGGPLELVPHDLEKLAAPFSLVLPWAPELADQLNKSNFEISGA
ncbi:MAG TPA: hypothetical protein VG778_12050, partial [Blastocatellia bacterium]|nr:hypothetical protein [Blastocatellia bacterium]